MSWLKVIVQISQHLCDYFLMNEVNPSLSPPAESLQTISMAAIHSNSAIHKAVCHDAKIF